MSDEYLTEELKLEYKNSTDIAEKIKKDIAEKIKKFLDIEK